MADLDRGRMKGKKARDIASLFKKAKELSILCGILVSIIIFSPQEEIPIMWPNERECTAILTRYVGFSEKERLKKLAQHEDYLMDKLRSRKKKIKEKWRKILQNKEEREMKIMFEQLLDGKINLSEHNLDAGKIRELLKLSALARIKVNERKEQLNRQSQISQLSSLFPNFNPIMMEINNVDQNCCFCVDGAVSTSLVCDNRGKRKLIEDQSQTSQPSSLFPNFNPIMVEINNIDQNRCFFVDDAASTSLVGVNRGKRKLMEDQSQTSQPSSLFPNFNPIMMEINNIDQNRCFCVDGATSTSLVGDNHGKRKLIEDQSQTSQPLSLFPNFNPIMVEINNIYQNRCFCVDDDTSTSLEGENRGKRKLTEVHDDESK